MAVEKLYDQWQQRHLLILVLNLLLLWVDLNDKSFIGDHIYVLYVVDISIIFVDDWNYWFLSKLLIQ
jgi:hypothetical protein